MPEVSSCAQARLVSWTAGSELGTLSAATAREALLDVWERSVRATHGFLDEATIVALRPEVEAALACVRLFVALEPLNVEELNGAAASRPSLPRQHTETTTLFPHDDGAHALKWMQDHSESALAVAPTGEAYPRGFAGIDGERLEMLFVDAAWRGRGLGSLLLRRVLAEGVREVEVNEANPDARAFYAHWGFRVVERLPLDGQGRPFPLLRMRLE